MSWYISNLSACLWVIVSVYGMNFICFAILNLLLSLFVCGRFLYLCHTLATVLCVQNGRLHRLQIFKFHHYCTTYMPVDCKVFCFRFFVFVFCFSFFELFAHCNCESTHVFGEISYFISIHSFLFSIYVCAYLFLENEHLNCEKNKKND